MLKQFCYLLLIVAAVVFLFSQHTIRGHKWSLIRVPLALNASQATTAEFVADLDTIYFVQVDLKRNLPFEELEKIHLPRITWSVTSQGRSVGQEYSGGYSGETVGHIIGKFKGITGRKYQLRVQLKQDAFFLQELDPHVVVEVTPSRFKQYLLISWVLNCLSILLLVISIGGLLFSHYRTKKRRESIDNSYKRRGSLQDTPN